jgi:predicted amidohydrolase
MGDGIGPSNRCAPTDQQNVGPNCFLTGYPDDGQTARRDTFTIDSPQIMLLLGATSHFEAAFIVGFKELRGPDLYNTVVVVHKGLLLGHYSKCSAYMKFHQQGREFPVFTHQGLTFGIIIRSDGGYIEPARRLALQGAQVIFAPHFNDIGAAGLISHFMKVRADHTARAVENSVYFVRGNSVSLGGKEECITGSEGIGDGDSYIVDPHSEIVIRRRRRHVEDMISIDIASETDRSWEVGRSMWSAREFGKKLMEIVEQAKT